MSHQDPAYYKRHRAVYKARGKASDQICECGATAKCWAQLHGTDGESPDQYRAMCWPCHHKYDGRWSEEERAKVRVAVKKIWDESPERKRSMSINPHRSRGASRLAEGGEA